jgi:hydrogenase nickel incorporation protein HypB
MRLRSNTRGFLLAKETVCLNVVGSPGSGKTSLLEKACLAMKKDRGICIIEGDQQSQLDAERLRSSAGESVPATGLFLTAVAYPEGFDIPPPGTSKPS